MLLAVWFVGTGLATGLAFVAVSLVLAGVSEQGAEQLRLVGTSIYEPAVLSARPPGTKRAHRAGAPAPTSTPGDAGSGDAAGSTDVNPAPGSDPAAPTTTPAAAAENPSSGDGGATQVPQPQDAQAPLRRPSSTTTPPTQSTTATFSAAGGVVTVSCTGTSARLVSASPTGGYKMDVSEAGPEKVAVSFESGDRESEIAARCVSGRPRLED